MKKISQNFIVVIGVIVTVMVILGTFAGFSKTETTLQHREKIYPFDKDSSKPSAIPVKITDIKPNSAIYFMYPPGLSPLGADNHFQKFLLIRLPIWMDGGSNEISSFRAYSAVDLASHCLLMYWGQFERQRLEDPCTSPPYRIIDGIAEHWPNSNLIRAPSTGALPMLELSADENGYIYVEPPTLTPEKNGVVGYGRMVSEKEFKQGSELMRAFEDRREKIMSSFYLPNELSTGHKLVEIFYESGAKNAHYINSEEPENSMNISIEYCNCTKNYQDFLETEGKHLYGDFWQVNETDIYGVPNKVDVRNHIYSMYKFIFYKDGFRVAFTTNLSFDDGIRLVLENYFPEQSPSDVIKIET